MMRYSCPIGPIWTCYSEWPWITNPGHAGMSVEIQISGFSLYHHWLSPGHQLLLLLAISSAGLVGSKWLISPSLSPVLSFPGSSMLDTILATVSTCPATPLLLWSLLIFPILSFFSQKSHNLFQKNLSDTSQKAIWLSLGILDSSKQSYLCLDSTYTH